MTLLGLLWPILRGVCLFLAILSPWETYWSHSPILAHRVRGSLTRKGEGGPSRARKGCVPRENYDVIFAKAVVVLLEE